MSNGVNLDILCIVDENDELLDSYKKKPLNEATREMMTVLFKSTQLGKWNAFLDALKPGMDYVN